MHCITYVLYHTVFVLHFCCITHELHCIFLHHICTVCMCRITHRSFTFGNKKWYAQDWVAGGIAVITEVYWTCSVHWSITMNAQHQSGHQAAVWYSPLWGLYTIPLLLPLWEAYWKSMDPQQSFKPTHAIHMVSGLHVAMKIQCVYGALHSFNQMCLRITQKKYTFVNYKNRKVYVVLNIC